MLFTYFICTVRWDFQDSSQWTVTIVADPVGGCSRVTDKINYISVKPTDALVSRFILVQNSTCFGYFLYPSSGMSYCTVGTGTYYTGLTTASVQLHASCRQTCIIYASANCTVANSWWWAEELPETCRVLYKNKSGNECVCWFHRNVIYYDARSYECKIGQNYRISRPIRRNVIFSLGILEKNNDDCILILVIYWKKTGLLHTKISNHNIIYSS